MGPAHGCGQGSLKEQAEGSGVEAKGDGTVYFCGAGDMTRLVEEAEALDR